MEPLTINKSRKTKQEKYRHMNEPKTGDLLTQNSQTPREELNSKPTQKRTKYTKKEFHKATMTLNKPLCVFQSYPLMLSTLVKAVFINCTC